MKIKAIITLHVNGKEHAPDAVLDIADEEAERLIARGFAASGQEKTASASTSAKTTTTSTGDKPSPMIEDIVEAISGLDPTKDYGKNGKPNVEAIEALLGANISAAQRDQAWEIFQTDGKEE
jgi:DNA-binding ferritin-like protein